MKTLTSFLLQDITNIILDYLYKPDITNIILDYLYKPDIKSLNTEYVKML